MRLSTLHSVRVPALLAAAVAVAAVLAPAGSPAPPHHSLPGKIEPFRTRAVVGYSSPTALREALRLFPARVVRRLPSLHAVEVRPAGDPDDFASGVSQLPGIAFADRLEARRTHVEPALTAAFRPGLPYEWQYVATRANEVPDAVLRAASAFKIAVVDTGADVTHPDLAAKSPETWDIVRKQPGVYDRDGHGTFVSALAAGSVSNGEGIAGFGGDAQLLVVKASGKDGMFSDVDESAAIVYAVDHGAKVINLSLGGVGTSVVEKRAVEYAASHNVLLVAAAGNEYEDGNPVEYPAALLQPPGSKGQGGYGLAVGATNMAGRRAYFSNTGSHISLAAPGDSVFGAVAANARRDYWPRYSLPGSSSGSYGWSSGTSFSTPQVAGAAALVWAANPSLSALQVAGILKATASGKGAWNSALGYGMIDVAAAVAAATGQPIAERVQAGAALSLSRARARHHRARHGRAHRRSRMRRVQLAARLRTSSPTVSPDFRIVLLEVRRKHGWRRLARSATRSGGAARWTLGLRPGRYLLRVRYTGRWDLRGTTSHAIRLRVRAR